jgi:hypothetical protein
MRIADQLSEDLYIYGHAFCTKIDEPDLFQIERIPPSIILGGFYYA